MKSRILFPRFPGHNGAMTLHRSLILLAGSCLGLTACASKPEVAPKKAVEGPRLVGRIASIPPTRRFVIIQSYGKWTVETGQILTTRGPGDRVANLRTTGEAHGDFVAADVQSGSLELGDAVYYQTFVEKPTLSVPAQAAPSPEPVVKPETAPEIQNN